MAIVVQSYITDHCPSILSIPTKNYSRNYNYIRSIIDYNAIQRAIGSTDFLPIYNSSDPNACTNLFVSLFSDIVKKHTSIVKTPCSKRFKRPWMTSGLLRCIRNRDRMHRKLRGNPNNAVLKISYLRYRNFLNKLLKNLKREYQKQEFKKCKNLKDTWNSIKNITNLKKVKADAKELFMKSPNVTQNLNDINEYFAGIGKILAGEIVNKSDPSVLYDNFCIRDHPCDSLVLLNVDESEVDGLINGLRNNCSVGWDGISSRILKDSRAIFVPLITHICNAAINTGVFPDAMKIALVHPIYKSGDRDVVGNYRPISVLPAISKILEKVLNIRLIKFLESKNLISANQFGFRKGLSTVDAVASFVNDVVEGLDKSEKCLAVFLDLSKAFDTVSVPRLLMKLERHGVRGHALSIFKDYLSSRCPLWCTG